MNQKKDNLPEYELRDGFSDDLKALFEPPKADWAVTDRAVMDRASQVLLRQRKRRWGYWPAAAAAAVLIAAGLLLMQYQPEKPPLATVAEDIDQNGRVDILDAFKLAKMVQSAAVPQGRWDMNNDGAVNQQDVDIIAQAAVALKKEIL